MMAIGLGSGLESISKHHPTGMVNAGKAEVIAAMKALGHPVTDDNEADALALL